jgi:hypothetical protein
MTAETHPDPFHDAMGHGLQRAVQITSCAVTAAQVYLYQQRNQAMATAERDERTRRALATQIRADTEAARTAWAPALNPDWLNQADLLQTATVWGAAMPYADRSVPWYQPAAAAAMRRAEDHLRDLHPYAMAHYDRLRNDGTSPADAMRQAAPLFARPPRAQDTPYASRLPLHPGAGENLIWTVAEPALGPGETGALELAEAQERRGWQILDALQAHAREQHREPLGEAEQRTVLETITNLPAHIIDRIVRSSGAAKVSRPNAQGVAANAVAMASRPAHPPWEQDFPVPIETVVASASDAPKASAPTTTPAQRRNRGRHRR